MKVLRAVLAAVFALSLLASAAPQAASQSGGLSGVAYVWVFGYDGGSFLPSKELGLSQATVLTVISGLSQAVGGPSHLAVVSAVTETPGNAFTPVRLTAAREFVVQVRELAGTVFGRIPLDLYNVTSKQSIFAEVGKYQSQLDLNGVLLDKASEYYLAVGQANFNAMMQKLVALYPKVTFILNNASGAVAIAPLVGTTWVENTIVSPTTKPGTDLSLNPALMKELYSLYGGKVLLHLDANPLVNSEPMNIFGEGTPAAQVATVDALVSEGLSPSSSGLAFNFLFPVLGAATCACATPASQIYNSVSIGFNHRSTLQAFLPAIEAEAAA